LKTVEDLIKSRQVREAVIRELGEVPESILRYDRSDLAIDFTPERRGYATTSRLYGNNGDMPPQLLKAFDVSGQDCRGGALSRFPQNVGRILLRLYSERGNTVVDPFAGHNSRMELCWRSGRNYIGHDISRDFIETNKQIAALLEQEAEQDLFGAEHYTAWIRLHECDSRAMPTADGTGDFTITSPPYWNLEYYGDETAQLGRRSYEDFLVQLFGVAAENYRCLKPGAYCVWCVNDFRKNGRFYPFHEDTAALLRAAGFQQHDTLVTDLGPAIRAAFAAQVLATKIIPKRHEYCLVFRRKETPTGGRPPAKPEAPRQMLLPLS
jgi:DNA modification methylase